jgi:heme-degrading monooxygenase HmoA
MEVLMPHIQAEQQPVIQITVVESQPDKQAEALSLMTERARFMARQPGFISISLHRSLDGKRIVNYVQWQNSELLRSAHRSPEFRKVRTCTRSRRWWTAGFYCVRGGHVKTDRDRSSLGGAEVTDTLRAIRGQ